MVNEQVMTHDPYSIFTIQFLCMRLACCFMLSRHKITCLDANIKTEWGVSTCQSSRMHDIGNEFSCGKRKPITVCREQFQVERVVFCARAKHTFVDRNNNNIMAAPVPRTISLGRHFVSVSCSRRTTSGICLLCLANVCKRSPPTYYKVDTVS